MPLRAGVDLGGTKIQVVVTDDQHDVLGQARHPTPKEDGPQGVADGIVAAIREALEGAGAEPDRLEGIGIGSPGVADDGAGTITQARNVTPDWTGSSPLASANGIHGRAVRRATTCWPMAPRALGAHASLLGVFWGTGVGSGISSTTSPVGRAAGELGHMVVKLNGARCTCGRNGCVEAYAGRRAMELHAQHLHEKGHHTDLFKIMQRRERDTLSSGVWARALEHEDTMAEELIERAIAALAAGIASAVNLMDFEAVVIGGGLGSRLGEPYVARIRPQMLPHLFVDDNPPKVVVAALGDLGGAIGAAMQVDLP
jgi:glucokinase